MKTGRKPKSALQRQLDGSGPVRRAVSDNPITCDLPPEMPDRVADDPIACQAWLQLMAVAPEGLLTALDTSLLSVYAQSVSLAHRALVDVDDNGLVNARGAKNPSVSVLKAANAMILKCLDRMGLAGRSRAHEPAGQAARVEVWRPDRPTEGLSSSGVKNGGLMTYAAIRGSLAFVIIEAVLIEAMHVCGYYLMSCSRFFIISVTWTHVSIHPMSNFFFEALMAYLFFRQVFMM